MNAFEIVICFKHLVNFIFFISVFIIPQRYVFAIMALLAVANAYTMRVCLNLAITQMVKKHVAVEGDAHYDPNACPDPTTKVNTTVTMTDYLTRDSNVCIPVCFNYNLPSKYTKGVGLI